MPSLHRRPESPFWVAAYTDAKGRRLKKSTKTSNRALAMKIAVEWENAAVAGRAGRLVESQCRRVLSEIHEQATGEPLNFFTCGQWLDEWVEGKTGATSERTLLKYRQICRDFIDHLGERAKAPINAISQRDVRSFRDSLAKTGLSPSTVNQTVRKVLSAPFAAAMRAGYLTVNPCSGVEALIESGEQKKDVFTSSQVFDLYKAAEGDWKGVILTGYFTGLRLTDVVQLHWEAINLEEKVIRIRTRKTGATVVIPLAEDLEKWLHSQARGIGKAPVFPSLVKQNGGGKTGLSMQFKTIMKRAGVEGRIVRSRIEKSAGRTLNSLSFHSLRHSFNSALANAGVSQEIRQKLTGHATAAMNARYTHYEVEPLRTAVEKLPRLIS